MSAVYFLLEVEPTDAQKEQCAGIRRALAADLWICKLSTNGNATLFGGGREALTASQARLRTDSPEFNGDPPDAPL